MDYEKLLDEIERTSLSCLPALPILPGPGGGYRDPSPALTALLSQRVTDLWTRDPRDMPPWVPEEARRYLRLPRGELGWGDCCFPLQPEVVCLPPGIAEGSTPGLATLGAGASTGYIDLLVMDAMKVVNGAPDVIPPDPSEPPPPVPDTEGERCYGFAEPYPGPTPSSSSTSPAPGPTPSSSSTSPAPGPTPSSSSTSPAPGPSLVRLHEYWSYPERYIPASAFCDNNNVADVIMALYAFCDVTNSQLDGPIPRMDQMGEEFMFSIISKGGGVLSELGGASKDEITNQKFCVRIRRAIKGFGWPKVMENWVTRSRSSDWPPERLINTSGSAPCYYIPVCGEAGGWRCCLRLQESVLMDAIFGEQEVTDLAGVSRKCVQQVFTLVTSLVDTLGRDVILHAIFWCLEKTSSETWTEDAVWDRTGDVLTLVRSSLERLYLPHYIRPEINLVSGWADCGALLSQLEKAINNPTDVYTSITAHAQQEIDPKHAQVKQKIAKFITEGKFLSAPRENAENSPPALLKICDVFLGRIKETFIDSLAEAATADAPNQSLSSLIPLHESYTSLLQAGVVCHTCTTNISFPDLLFSLGENLVLDNEFPDVDDVIAATILDGLRNLLCDVIDMKVLHGLTGEEKSLTQFYTDIQETHLNIDAFLPVYTSYILLMNRISSIKHPPRRRQCFDPDPLGEFRSRRSETLDSLLKDVLYPAGYHGYRRSRDVTSSSPYLTSVPHNPNLPFFANRMADAQLRQFARFGDTPRGVAFQDWCFQGSGVSEQMLPLLATTNIYIGLHCVAILLDSVDIEGATQLVFDLENYLQDDKAASCLVTSVDTVTSGDTVASGDTVTSGETVMSGDTVTSADTETSGETDDRTEDEKSKPSSASEEAERSGQGDEEVEGVVKDILEECVAEVVSGEQEAGGAVIQSRGQEAGGAGIQSGVEGSEGWVVLDTPLYESSKQGHEKENPEGDSSRSRDNESRDGKSGSGEEESREEGQSFLRERVVTSHDTGGRFCLLTPSCHPLLTLLTSAMTRERSTLTSALGCASPALSCVRHNPELSWPASVAALLQAALVEGRDATLAVTPDNRGSLAEQMRRILSLSHNDSVQLPYDMVLECLKNICLELTAT